MQVALRAKPTKLASTSAAEAVVCSRRLLRNNTRDSSGNVGGCCLFPAFVGQHEQLEGGGRRKDEGCGFRAEAVRSKREWWAPALDGACAQHVILCVRAAAVTSKTECWKASVDGAGVQGFVLPVSRRGRAK